MEFDKAWSCGQESQDETIVFIMQASMVAMTEKRNHTSCITPQKSNQCTMKTIHLARIELATFSV